MSLTRILWLCVFAFVSAMGYAQTCTLSGAGTVLWDNTTSPGCNEGGTAGSSSIIVVPAGVTLEFDTNDDTWTGTRIDVFGTLKITAPGQVTINSSIHIKSTGFLDIVTKLNIGTTAGCGYTLSIDAGGSASVGNGASDRLTICGNEIARGSGGGCNPYPAGPTPYCEPSGGFTGPASFDETGGGPLPVKLAYFKAKAENENVKLEWATALEQNFDKFVVERSADGKNFTDIGEKTGAGNSSMFLKYSLSDMNPILGRNYYRLRSVDLDQTFEYSEVVMADFTGERKVSIFPSPSNGNFAKVLINFNPSETDRIEIFDNLGTYLYSYNVSSIESNMEFKNTLQSGVYLLRYTAHNFNKTVRFSVE